ncbi:MAG: ABC transporter substrate-binding protein [Myxococcota bacterium]
MTVIFPSVLLALAAEAGPGFDDTTIRVGMSTVLSGSAAGLGQEMKRGVDMYFAVVNEKGGVHGRRLELTALDDGYEPARTAPNMRKLIDEHDVFAVVGNVGTPTAVVSVPIANEKKVPLFGALTGAGLLRRSPPDRYVLNFRASYNQEMKAMIDGLVDEAGIPPDRIAFFTQNDAYGDAGFSGAAKALRARGYDEIARNVHGRYQRNTVNVEDGLERILDARLQPLAVIMVGTYKACAKFVRLARRERFDAVFLNLSFVGAENLARELDGVGDGRVVITQVVPPPSAALPATVSYRRAAGARPSTFNSLEGWLAAKAFVAGLESVGRDLSREKFIDAMEASQDLDLGLGQSHALSADQHQVSHTVWPTLLRTGRWQEFRWARFRRVLRQRLARLQRTGGR